MAGELGKLVYIPNMFETHNRVVTYIEIGKPVKGYLPENLSYPQVYLLHNGQRIRNAEEYLDSFCFHHDGEELIIRVVPTGIGASIMAAVLSVQASSLAGWGAFAAAAIDFVITTAVSFAVGAIANAAIGQPKPENRQTHGNSEESATYSWDGIHNTTRNGTPIQIVYGVHKVAGQFLSTFTKAMADGSNKLYALVGLCAGEISAVNGKTTAQDALTGDTCGTGLEFDNNAAELFTGIEVSYRMGEWDQKIISGFDDNPIPYGQNIPIEEKTDTNTYTTTGDVQAVELKFRFPSGLYRLNERGSFLPYECQVRVRSKEQGGIYGAWETITFSAQTRSEYNEHYRIEFDDAATYVIEIDRLTANDGNYERSICYLTGVNEITYDDVPYGGVALCGVKALASDQLNGQLPNITNTVHGKKVCVYQADDHFGSDTQQELLTSGDTEKLWGWYGENTDYATTAFTHNYADETLNVTILDETTSNWDHSTTTGPFFYKQITGNFDLRIDVSISTNKGEGDGVGLVCRSQDDATDWVGVFLQQVSDTASGGTPEDKVRDANTNDGTTTESIAAAAVDALRIVRSDDDFTCYYSTDGGDSWTASSSAFTRTDMSDTVDLGLTCYCSSSTASITRFAFSDMTFADTTSYTTECSSNPAWVIYDLLTDEHYGIGTYLDTSQIDTTSFVNFASYCKTLVGDGKTGQHERHRFDGIIDSVKSGWEQVLRICENARATLLKQGDKIHVSWQEASDAVQMFTVGNIKSGSLKTSYRTPELNANYWEVQFLNRDNEYEQDYITYLDPNIASGDPYRRQTINKYGITRPAEAHREAKFRALANRYITQSVEFETGIDAVACEPGDVIEVQHSTPQWGTGGRVQGGSSTTVDLSDVFTISAGTTYEIMVRHSDDTIETRTVTSSAGDHWTVTVSPAFDTTPAADELYAIGQENIETKPFTVTRIARSGDLECTIQAIEYVEDIFDDDIDTLPDIVYSELPDPRSIPTDVKRLLLSERAQIQADGVVLNVIDVTYVLPETADRAIIYYRENGKTAWQYGGQTTGSHFVLAENIAYGITYDVVVAPVSGFGVHKQPGALTDGMQTITISGRTSRPSDVSNLRLSRVGDTVYLRWDAVTDADLQGYEVRYGLSAWSTATVLGFTPDNQYNTVNFAEGQAYYQVKAMNTSGVYSSTAAFVHQTLAGRLNKNIVVESDEAAGHTETWPGTKTDMTVSGDDLVLDVDQTAPETSGSYVTQELDCGASVRPIVTVFTTIRQADLTLTWATATFTWDSNRAQNTTWSGITTDTEGEALDQHITSTLKFRYGDTSGSLGDYEDFQVGEYTGQYFQFKLEVETDSESYSATVEDMVIKLDVPDIFASGESVTVAGASSTTITFSDYTDDGFNVVPDFLAIPHQNVGTDSTVDPGDFVEVLDVTKTEATVRYYDGSGVQEEGKINFIARGY